MLAVNVPRIQAIMTVSVIYSILTTEISSTILIVVKTTHLPQSFTSMKK